MLVLFQAMMLDLTTLQAALDRFEKVLARTEQTARTAGDDEVLLDALRAGVVKHFEIVYELSWKLVQRWIKINVSFEDAMFPRTRRELFRIAAQQGLIADPARWFAFGDARNLTSHTYNAETADTVYAEACRFAPEARALLVALEQQND